MHAANVAGLAVAILNERKVVYVHAFGERDRDRHLPLTIDSVMSAASFSKAAFAYLVMQLVEEHTLDLDKPVYRYLPRPLPEYARYADLDGDDRYRRITARMLLSHTAGFPNVRALNRGRLNITFEPGTRYAYSGEGFQLLQLVVEEAAGAQLYRLMASRIFEPFGMKRTSMVWQLPFEQDFANGYDRNGRSLGPQRRRSADAAGSMQTSIADFSRFVAAVMQGKSLTRTTRTLMFTPQVAITTRTQFPSLTTETTDRNDAIRLGYGLGWACSSRRSAKPSSRKGTTTAGSTTPSPLTPRCRDRADVEQRERRGHLSRAARAADRQHVHANRMGRLRPVRSAAAAVALRALRAGEKLEMRSQKSDFRNGSRRVSASDGPHQNPRTQVRQWGPPHVEITR